MPVVEVDWDRRREMAEVMLLGRAGGVVDRGKMGGRWDMAEMAEGRREEEAIGDEVVSMESVGGRGWVGGGRGAVVCKCRVASLDVTARRVSQAPLAAKV